MVKGLNPQPSNFQLDVIAIWIKDLFIGSTNKVEMGPDPTRPYWAYFWPIFDSGTFWPKGKKIFKMAFLVEIFQTQTQIKNGWPDPTRVKNFWPGPITVMDLRKNGGSLLMSHF